MSNKKRACNHSGDFYGVICAACGLLVGNCCGTFDSDENPVCGNCAQEATEEKLDRLDKHCETCSCR